jgi:hypothetical protein
MTIGTSRADDPNQRTSLAHAMADEEHSETSTNAEQDEPVLSLGVIGVFYDQSFFVEERGLSPFE